MDKPTKKSKVVDTKPPVNKKPKKEERKFLALKKEYVAYYEVVPIQKLAAHWIKKDEDTIIRWRKDDPIFADEIAKAKSVFVKANVIRVKSSEFLLERLVNEHFGDKDKAKENKTLDKFMDRISKMIP